MNDPIQVVKDMHYRRWDTSINTVTKTDSELIDAVLYLHKLIEAQGKLIADLSTRTGMLEGDTYEVAPTEPGDDEKFEQESCPHEIVDQEGGVRYSNGDCWDDIRNVCRNCGATVK